MQNIVVNMCEKLHDDRSRNAEPEGIENLMITTPRTSTKQEQQQRGWPLRTRFRVQLYSYRPNSALISFIRSWLCSGTNSLCVCVRQFDTDYDEFIEQCELLQMMKQQFVTSRFRRNLTVTAGSLQSFG